MIAYALDKDGKIRNIRNVENGLNCGCVCMQCKQPLVANQGEIKRWHFSHNANSECGGESIIHYMAKMILVEAINNGEALRIPSASGTLSASDLQYTKHEQRWSTHTIEKHFVSAKEEVRIGDQIVDVMLEDETGSKLAVEINYTNAKSNSDVYKFTSKEQDSIEIYVGYLPWYASVGTIKKAVLNKSKRWYLHSAQESIAKHQLQATVNQSNAEILTVFDKHVEDLISGEGYKELPYPELVESMQHKDDLGVMQEGVARAKPVLTGVSGVLNRLSSGLIKTDGVVNNKTDIEVYLLLNDSVSVNTDKPAIALTFKDDKFVAKWLNTETWESKLADMALADLVKKMPNMKVRPAIIKRIEKYL